MRTVDDEVNVTASASPAIKLAKAGSAEARDGGTVRYTGTTSTRAPQARSIRGSTSRASRARGTSTQSPSVKPASMSRSATASARNSPGTRSATIPRSASSAAVAGPMAAMRAQASARASSPASTRRSKNAFTPFALVNTTNR